MVQTILQEQVFPEQTHFCIPGSHTHTFTHTTKQTEERLEPCDEVKHIPAHLNITETHLCVCLPEWQVLWTRQLANTALGPQGLPIYSANLTDTEKERKRI